MVILESDGVKKALFIGAGMLVRGVKPDLRVAA